MSCCFTLILYHIYICLLRGHHCFYPNILAGAHQTAFLSFQRSIGVGSRGVLAAHVVHLPNRGCLAVEFLQSPHILTDSFVPFQRAIHEKGHG